MLGRAIHYPSLWSAVISICQEQSGHTAKRELGAALANIFFPTRSHNILDLCFVNNEEIIAQTEVQETNTSDNKLVVNDTLYILDTKAHHEKQIREGLHELNF